MTTPRRVLTREEAFDILEQVGYPTGAFVTNTGVEVPFLVVQVAVAGAESDLYVDAEGPPNSNGTVDRGWLQVNSVHGFDDARLLSDPFYTAECAYNLLVLQGLRAWAAYNNKPYVRRLPPTYGGSVLSRADAAKQPFELVKSVQARLNTLLVGTTGFVPLVADGSFGAKTEAALGTWKKKVGLNDGHLKVDANTWVGLRLR